ncbi:MAG TPA: DnaB-like helicase C-terminal domain-containing protein, partial [Bacteroidales bacterium]|nr:DnaB-like helicase C-terminal domain-containing protein [Bacteroidales bacterium]
DGLSTKGLAEIIIAKNRHGAVDDVRLEFIPELTKFTDRNIIPELNDNIIDDITNIEKSFDTNFETKTFVSKMNQNQPIDISGDFDTTIDTNIPY